MKKITIGGLASVLIIISGCATNTQTARYPTQDTTKVAVEHIGAMSKREMAEKHLHTHSFMQSLMQLSIKEGFKTSFGPDDDDIFVSNAYPDTWKEGLNNIKRTKGIQVKVQRVSPRRKRVRIKDKRVGAYTKAKNHYFYPRILQGDKVSDKYIIMPSKKAESIIEKLYFTTGNKINLASSLDRIFSIGNAEGTNIYFSLNQKSNVIRVTEQPTFYTMTPYKRQFFINYLNTAGIGYTTNGNAVAIKDNFSNWVKGMNKLRKLMKYKHAVYAIHDGQNFFEVADGSYQKAPITIELIDWIPGGKREYNIYAQGYNRKIDTDKRFYDYYLPDGSKKYTIRFY